MIQIVSYDLRTPGRNYDNLYRALKSTGDWCHPNESLWLISTHQTAQQLRDFLLAYIDSNDSLFVTTYSKISAWSNLPIDVVNWLRTHQ